GRGADVVQHLSFHIERQRRALVDGGDLATVRRVSRRIDRAEELHVVADAELCDVVVCERWADVDFAVLLFDGHVRPFSVSWSGEGEAEAPRLQSVRSGHYGGDITSASGILMFTTTFSPARATTDVTGSLSE